MQRCPAHTYSPDGSELLTNCTCNKGYTGPDGVECEACDAGSLQGRERLALCDCALQGKYSTATGAISESTCSACPAYTYSADGSALLTNCTCNKGYTGPDGMQCAGVHCGDVQGRERLSAVRLCSQGKYSTAKAEISESTCSACPAHTYSGSGSSVLTNCTCNKGYTGPDGVECEACIAGTYKDVNGSAPCTLCSAGQVLDRDRRASRIDVQRVSGAHVLGSREQRADQLYMQQGVHGARWRECEACIAGTYKDVNGSAACTLCSRGKYSTATAGISESTCSACPAHTYSAAREQRADQLYMQQGVHGAGWGGMRGVYCGDVQGRERLSTVRLCSQGKYSTATGRDLRVNVQRVSGAHVLGCRAAAC